LVGSFGPRLVSPQIRYHSMHEIIFVVRLCICICMINVDIRIWTPVESACAFQVIPMMIWTPVESVCAFGVSAMVTWTPFEGACALGERLPSIRICKILLKIARGCKSIEFGNCHTQIQLISQSQINSWVVDSSLTGYSTIKP